MPSGPVALPLILTLAIIAVSYIAYQQTIPRRRYLMRGKLMLIKGGKYEAINLGPYKK